MPTPTKTAVPVGLQRTVDAVARFEEAGMLRSSKFHLASCGGCGCPSFQQPCKLCGFYPMGSDKGTWHPRQATFERFEAMIDRSGPGGRDGTIATWHARSMFDHMGTAAKLANRDVIEGFVLRAAEVECVDARAAWDAVACKDVSVTSSKGPAGASTAWVGVDDLAAVAKGSYRDEIRPEVAKAVMAAVAAWVEAVHGGDASAMREALEGVLDQARTLRHHVRSVGNVVSAIGYMEDGLDRLSAEAPAPAAR